jgi:ABC-type Zn2+ transport system substrate-binding protein/surface adhesin
VHVDERYRLSARNIETEGSEVVDDDDDDDDDDDEHDDNGDDAHRGDNDSSVLTHTHSRTEQWNTCLLPQRRGNDAVNV